MVHGDFKGVRNHPKVHLATVLTPGQSNILVYHSGCPRIADFGLAMVTQNQDSIRSAQGEHAHTARWTAPEILNEQGIYSKETDVFSFAMVMVEVRCRYLLWHHCLPTSSSPRHRLSPARSRFILTFLLRRRWRFGWGAAGTTDRPKSYERVVGIDEALLESRSSLAPGDGRGVKNLAWLVSFPLFPAASHLFTRFS